MRAQAISTVWRPWLAGLCLVSALMIGAPGIGWSASTPTTDARQPTWTQLSADQKQFLAPLAENWDSLPGQTRRKLLGIVARQSTMTAEQRERVQSRLAQWTQLSAEERDLARKNYQQLNRLPADQRQDVARRWQEAKQSGAPASATSAGGGEPATSRP